MTRFPMMNRLALSLAIIGFASPQFTQAQTIQRCGADEVYAQEILAEPSRAVRRAETEGIILEYLASEDQPESALHVIPVVFHVMYADNSDNISQEQIESAMTILNEDFRRQNSDASNLRAIFGNVGADMEIEFRLAQKDPNGNCTNGITRTQAPQSVDANNNVKSIIGWDNSKYLNIWVVRSIDIGIPGGIVLGYAAFPQVNLPGTQDGIVIRHDHLGNTGTAAGTRNRTLTHEAGHYFNLYHTFQGGCGGNDHCADTPPVAVASNGCNIAGPQNSCTNDNPDLPDMLENYMDYSDDACMNTFTLNQKSRAKAVLNSNLLRGSLAQASNLSFTGVSGTVTCSPVADFAINQTVICEGDSLDLTDLSAYQGTVTYQWQFIDINTAAVHSSSDPEPKMTLPAGDYHVQLQIQNSQGNDTELIQHALRVRPAAGVTMTNFFAPMESAIPNSLWSQTNNGDNVQWERSTQAYVSGSASYRYANDQLDKGIVGDGLILGPIQMGSGNSALTLTFNHSYAKKAPNSSDQLRIYASTDCGSTWNLVRLIPTFQLGIATTVPTTFTPQPGDWKQTSVPMNTFAAASTLMVKFEVVSGDGSTVWLDNARFQFTVGNLEHLAQDIRIAPNPSMGSAQLQLPAGIGQVDITIRDAQGRIINQFPSAEQHIALPTLSPGAYHVQVMAEGQILTHQRWIQM